MQVPLVLTFHNVERSQWAEDEIRGRVAELERIYGRLNSCRVRVDQRTESRTGSIPPVVRIELGIPGHRELVVSHEPSTCSENTSAPICATPSTKRFTPPSGCCGSQSHGSFLKKSPCGGSRSSSPVPTVDDRW